MNPDAPGLRVMADLSGRTRHAKSGAKMGRNPGFSSPSPEARMPIGEMTRKRQVGSSRHDSAKLSESSQSSDDDNGHDSRRKRRPKRKRDSSRGLLRSIASYFFAFLINVFQYLLLSASRTVGWALAWILMIFVVCLIVVFLLLVVFHIASQSGPFIYATIVSIVRDSLQKLYQLPPWLTCVSIGVGCTPPQGPNPLEVILNITSSATAEVQQSYNIIGSLSVFAGASNALMMNSVNRD
jgi:hypothetical protein